MTATQAQMHFGDVMRQVVEDGAPIIVEQAGEPQVAVISLADFERLCESLDGELGSPHQAALDQSGQEPSTSDTTGSDWWEEFERELHELPTEQGEG
jgi:prevent-host-death family protein